MVPTGIWLIQAGRVLDSFTLKQSAGKSFWLPVMIPLAVYGSVMATVKLPFFMSIETVQQVS